MEPHRKADRRSNNMMIAIANLSHQPNSHHSMLPGEAVISMAHTLLDGEVKGQRNRGTPKRFWEKNVEDWMVAIVWRVGRTAEDRLMFRRSTKAATSGNG